MKKIYKIKTLIFSLSSIMFFLSADFSLPSSYEEIEVVSNLPRGNISAKVTFKNVTLSEVNFMRNLFSIGIVGETSSADINSIIFDYSTFSRSIPKKISHGDNRYTPIFKLNKRTVENSDLKKLYNWLQPEGKILLRSICSFFNSADNTKKIIKKNDGLLFK